MSELWSMVGELTGEGIGVLIRRRLTNGDTQLPAEALRCAWEPMPPRDGTPREPSFTIGSRGAGRAHRAYLQGTG